MYLESFFLIMQEIQTVAERRYGNGVPVRNDKKTTSFQTCNKITVKTSTGNKTVEFNIHRSLFIVLVF